MKRNKNIYSITASLIILLSINVPGAAASTQVIVNGNGSGSDSTVVFQQQFTTVVEQNNETNVENNVDVNANTGNNTASGNTGGDSTIQTGDVNIGNNIQNQANSSTTSVGCCESNATNIEVTGNGDNSTNTAVVNKYSSTNVNVNQNANITNNVIVKANTGGNDTSYNNGDNYSKTGDIKVGGEVKNGPINVDSTNVRSENQGASVKIANNGSNSLNTVFLDQNNNNDVNINNNVKIYNNIYFYLLTGNNKSNSNVGGSTIITGNVLVDFFLTNGPINVSSVSIDCCGKADEDDRKDIDNGDPKDEPKNGKDDIKDKDENDKKADKEDKKEGQLLAQAAATEFVGDGTAILGLSDTSSGNNVDYWFWLGLFALAFGLKLIGEAITSKPAYNNA